MTKVIEKKEQSDVKIKLLNFKLDNITEHLHQKQRKLNRKNYHKIVSEIKRNWCY